MVSAIKASNTRHAAGLAKMGRRNLAPNPSALNHRMLPSAAPAPNHQRSSPCWLAREPNNKTVSR